MENQSDYSLVTLLIPKNSLPGIWKTGSFMNWSCAGYFNRMNANKMPGTAYEQFRLWYRNYKPTYDGMGF